MTIDSVVIECPDGVSGVITDDGRRTNHQKIFCSGDLLTSLFPRDA